VRGHLRAQPATNRTPLPRSRRSVASAPAIVYRYNSIAPIVIGLLRRIHWSQRQNRYTGGLVDKSQIEKAVLDDYSKRYPLWTEVRVTDMADESFGGNLVVVQSITEDGTPNEELCFGYPDGTVRMFSSTRELADFLEKKANAPFLERVFTRSIFSGLVFTFLLIAVFIIGFFDKDHFRPEVLTMLGSVLGAAAGFFFGSSKIN
jgi:hypothetical protein